MYMNPKNNLDVSELFSTFVTKQRVSEYVTYVNAYRWCLASLAVLAGVGNKKQISSNANNGSNASLSTLNCNNSVSNLNSNAGFK